MINFSEKIIVLTKTDSGELPTVIVKTRGGRSEITLQMNGSFDYVIYTDGQNSVREYDIMCAPDFVLNDKFACGVYLGEKLISYGSAGNISKKEFLKIADSLAYDDWQIATENYYSGSVYDKADDNVKTQIGKEKGGQVQERVNYFEQNDEDGGFGKEQKTDCGEIKDLENSECACPTEKCFYDKIRCCIENLLQSGESFSPLCSLVPFSRFIKVTEKDKTYFLGTQGRGAPDYIVYGVKGTVSAPPDGFTDAFFVPESLFFNSANGYYLLFISAKTGETIKIRTV